MDLKDSYDEKKVPEFPGAVHIPASEDDRKVKMTPGILEDMKMLREFERENREAFEKRRHTPFP